MERNTARPAGTKKARLPESWKVADEYVGRAGKLLYEALGGHLHERTAKNAGFLRYGTKWYVVRFFDDGYKVNLFGQRRRLYPWQRRLEIIGAGDSLDECLFQVRGGICRAMVGHGYRPIRDEEGEWIGMTDAAGVPVDAGAIVGS